VLSVWTAFVTAFLALCAALGLSTTAASAAVPRMETARNSETGAPTATVPAVAPRAWPRAGALPPTMKQRIRAEAHGTSPSCRHRPATDATAAAHSAALCDTAGRDIAGRAGTEPLAPTDPPLQR
ncbi:DUF6344 domain-containing protein, partial [Streptomyces sp. TRM76130]|nr:DUF6344 domain-containing protein [Streptomyces sp. TRM76130]